MEKTNFNDGLMAQMIEEEAGKDLSGNYPWSEALLERLKPTFPHQYITRLCFLVPGHP